MMYQTCQAGENPEQPPYLWTLGCATHVRRSLWPVYPPDILDIRQLLPLSPCPAIILQDRKRDNGALVFERASARVRRAQRGETLPLSRADVRLMYDSMRRCSSAFSSKLTRPACPACPASSTRDPGTTAHGCATQCHESDHDVGQSEAMGTDGAKSAWWREWRAAKGGGGADQLMHAITRRPRFTPIQVAPRCLAVRRRRRAGLAPHHRWDQCSETSLTQTSGGHHTHQTHCQAGQEFSASHRGHHGHRGQRLQRADTEPTGDPNSSPSHAARTSLPCAH